MTVNTDTPRLGDSLAESLRLGEPDVAGPLAVFPLFGPEPELEYVSFAQAAGSGVRVRELSQNASVNDLVVENSTGTAVLLYEGEEVTGARQDRTFDVSVLVAAGSKLRIPVSCVEHGRWDGLRHHEDFAPAPRATYPELRRMKNRATRERVAAGLDARAEQGAVWDAVSARSARMGVASPTGAMGDIYVDRHALIEQICGGIRLHAGQTGALAMLGGRPVVLDHVSRPEVFASLHDPLVRGYALDALSLAARTAPVDAPVDPATALAFLARVHEATVTEHDGIGLGRDVRFADAAVAGAGLVAGAELAQLTAFPADDGAPPAPGTQIRRPSRRRAPRA